MQDESKAEARRWLDKSVDLCGRVMRQEVTGNDFAKHSTAASLKFQCLAVVKRSFELVSRRTSSSDPKALAFLIVESVWSLVTHPDPGVRSVVGALVVGIVPHVAGADVRMRESSHQSESEITSRGSLMGTRILPAMVTLVNDHDS